MLGVIAIRGARTHNLKNLDLDLPRNRLIVITGVSGSGKSGLAFDTLYAEGQRRYVESLSAYARQFLERMDRPDVDEIKGISPAVAIEQKNPVKSSRSTVATATEIHDYLRLLFARIGRTICPQCGREVKKDQVEDVLNALRGLPSAAQILVTFPLRREAERVLEKDSLSQRLDFSQTYECAACRTQFIELQPRLFSFNNPFGACPTCRGFGDVIEIDLDLVVPDQSKSLRDGAIVPWATDRHFEIHLWMLEVARRYRISTTKPFRELSKRELKIIMDGEPEGEFPGIRGFFNRLESKRYKIGIRVFLSRYRGYVRCPDCDGSRLRQEALNVRICHPPSGPLFRKIDDAQRLQEICEPTARTVAKTIADVCRMTIAEAYRYFVDLQLTPFEESIAHQILKELRNRLGYLVDAGLGYLTLDRRTQTLSGGESQRINLATILGSQLVGALYILDEPTIGLHPRDNQRLIHILKMLQEIGNTVMVVEHDREMMETSDYIVDLGPAAGRLGGEIVFSGAFTELIKDGKASLSGAYLKGKKNIPVPHRRRNWKDCLEIRGAREHNLKNLDVKIPLNVFVAVTGVSGSGKSTLVHEVLYSGLRRAFGQWPKRVGAHDEIRGVNFIDDAILVDQSPIGKMAEKDKQAAKAVQKLQLLKDVGLGYMQLGQPATTLSGGEAQRVKLAAHLAQKEGKHILYIFDEPTTGLHFDDVSKLLQCFDRLLAAGNSLLVIEHNMEVIKCADWIVDLGPEGGDAGGYVIAQGTPEEVAQHGNSWTGSFLRKALAN